MKMISKIVKVTFLVVAAATIYEYMFVLGMFTSIIMMYLVLGTGLINVIVALKEKKYNEAGLYFLASIALCMGYWNIMFS